MTKTYHWPEPAPAEPTPEQKLEAVFIRAAVDAANELLMLHSRGALCPSAAFAAASYKLALVRFQNNDAFAAPTEAVHGQRRTGAT